MFRLWRKGTPEHVLDDPDGAIRRLSNGPTPSLVAIANFRKGKMRGSTEDRVAFLETKPRKRRDVRRLLYRYHPSSNASAYAYLSGRINRRRSGTGRAGRGFGRRRCAAVCLQQPGT